MDEELSRARVARVAGQAIDAMFERLVAGVDAALCGDDASPLEIAWTAQALRRGATRH